MKKLKKWQKKSNESRLLKNKPIKYPEPIDPNETLIERIERKQVEARRAWLLSQPSTANNYISNYSNKSNCHRGKDWYSK